jgi:hypothetical protein
MALNNILDKTIRLYQTHNGEYKEFKKFCVSSVGWSILDTAFSPDSKYFVYSSWSDYCKYLYHIIFFK